MNGEFTPSKWSKHLNPVRAAHQPGVRDAPAHRGCMPAPAESAAMTSPAIPTVRAGLPALLLSVAVCYLAAAIGALASIDARVFYAELTRPAWAPPGWVFGPVWTVLYTMMAVTLWRLLRLGRATRGVQVLFGVQLAVNALWSWTFFAWRHGALAMATVVLLLGLVAATAWQAGRHDRLAGALLWPYLAWVSFATALTGAVWRLNPALLG